MAEKKAKYWEAVGRRKTSSARVRLYTEGTKNVLINDKKIDDYFPLPSLGQKAVAPLKEAKLLSKFKVTVRVRGGGISSQASAVQHGLARALVKFDPELKEKMKERGFLTRDPRMKERKKPGLKRARKAPQWQKR
jgi:small subunit ribosomal protein S9